MGDVLSTANYLGIDCGSVSLNLVLLLEGTEEPVTVYRRTQGRPLHTLVHAVDELTRKCGRDIPLENTLVTGSGREFLSNCLGLPAINEISAHGNGVYRVDPRVRTVIEIGGQDSKFIRIEPSSNGKSPTFRMFRMNEICAAGTGAFLDEQAARLGIPVEAFGSTALTSCNPAPVAGRCAVFAKTDMIHKAQEGIPIPDILMGLAFALARNYLATLVRGEPVVPLVSLQGGVMLNEAVVQAFKSVLELGDDEVTLPPYFTVLGALGCANLARERPAHRGLTLGALRERAGNSLNRTATVSFLPPLSKALDTKAPALTLQDPQHASGPFVMGIDVGSVSVKGVLTDGHGRIIREDYRLSRSRPLETLTEVIISLSDGEAFPDLLAVTGSGRYLAGRLLDADLIVNEISAQARAALSHDPQADTIVEIGGQDSKWISLESGEIKDFQMNRVCAAGTGSFLMEQADRLNLGLGEEFSKAAFTAERPADLGTRCTVFMESDLIHHQNNGASSADLAAGVCLSIVHNYLEKVANYKSLGQRVLFLGGVAATPAVRAAFERQTGRPFQVPAFHKVSGALGAALKALDSLHAGEKLVRRERTLQFDPASVPREQFRCKGCQNQCVIDKYQPGNRTIFHGGLCDRWEGEKGYSSRGDEADPFEVRSKLLTDLSAEASKTSMAWGMVRSLQFFEWFPFWRAFCEQLGISLVPSPPSSRAQFERGCRHVRVETCLPMKVPAGQISDLVHAGIRTVFHPVIQSEPPVRRGSTPQIHCPYVQAAAQLFKGSFDVQWKEVLANRELDPDAIRREHIRFAIQEGFSRDQAVRAVDRGLEAMERFRGEIRRAGQQFLETLGAGETALVVMGKPYHTSDAFLNMNLSGLFRRLGVQAMPGDLYPFEGDRIQSMVTWKYQANMVRVAAEIAGDPRLFPVVITFFGCGPDPFTLRHVKEVLGQKPLLILEMDEHTSRAGIMTRVEAFLERITSYRKDRGAAQRTGGAAKRSLEAAEGHLSLPGTITYQSRWSQAGTGAGNHPRPKELYMPFTGVSAYGLAAAARSVGIETYVLPEPDHESERLGNPHLVGGECHPYALVLGDYLKLFHAIPEHRGRRSLFYILGPDACRLGQYPHYIEKVRRHVGSPIGVIWEIEQGLKAFGISERHCQRVLIRGWEGLNAYDLVQRLFYCIRPLVEDRERLEAAYVSACDNLFAGLSEGRIRRGMEEALHELYQVPVNGDESERPIIAVTGDYYTRVVPFANNQVYQEVEKLGGLLWVPPTFSDCFKMDNLKQFIWAVLSRRAREVAAKGVLYLAMTISEFKVKGGKLARQNLNGPLDISGRQMWKWTAANADPRLPAGITGPLVTTLQDVQAGAHGVLNLITLNCLYGTVVTAALGRALKAGEGVPMLTLVYEGLKKTNEKTRVEAFMDQVHDYWHIRKGSVRR